MTKRRTFILILLSIVCAWGMVFEAEAQERMRPQQPPQAGRRLEPLRTPTGENEAPPNDSTIVAVDTVAAKNGKSPKIERDTSAPRVLETHLFNEEVKRQWLFTWLHNRYTNALELQRFDTLINDRFRDYPFLQRDAGANYLGTVGSAVILHNYFKRQSNDYFYYLTPYLEYALTPENSPFYNTKKPYVRFDYAGTLFGNASFEEGNVGILVSANLLPQWNWSIRYRHFGTRGMLSNEATDNNAFTLTTSYSGTRYNAHAGFIYNGWNNRENGGVVDDRNVLDTVMDMRVIDVALKSASSNINHYSFFVTQSYGVPLNFFRNDSTIKDDGTAIYFGHSGEYTTVARAYADQIAAGDTLGQRYYGNRFYINPTNSRDSMRSLLFDNKLFVTIQPWSSSFIISQVTGGVGYSFLSNYSFRPEFYVSPTQNETQHNLYLYGAAKGEFSRYFYWNAFARYDFAGYTQNDIRINGNVGLSIYPLRGGIHFTGNVLFQAKQPDYFLNNTYANHFIWQNDFDKTLETRIGAKVTIPNWQLEAGFDYSLLSQYVYFDDDAKPVQDNGEISVLAVHVKKNFKLWLFRFDHRALLQVSSNQAVLPLPLVSANFTYYLQGELVKNVLTAQLGVDAYYNTPYYAYAYNPGSGNFHTQQVREIGNYPFLDAFVNMKWKHATIFVKMVNVAEGWPHRDYFSALHYIRTQSVFKLGISWNFY